MNNANQRKRISIGLIIDNLDSEYHRIIVAGINTAIKEKEVNLFAFVGGALPYPGEKQNPRNIVYSFANRENIDGLIILSGSIGHFCGMEPIGEFCRQYLPLPIVSISQEINDIHSILVDNETGMRLLMQHCIRDHGYRRFAFLKGPEGNQEAGLRFRIFRDSCRESGITIDPKLIIPGDFLRSTGMKAVDSLITGRKVPFDVLIAANDEMAWGVIDELRKKGIRVPEDVAVTGFDDQRISKYLNPPLTTISQPLFDQGKKAVDVVYTLITGEYIQQNLPLTTILFSQIVVRRSCGCGGTSGGSSLKKTAENNHFNSAKDLSRIQGKEIDPADLDGLSDTFSASLRNKDALSFIDSINRLLDDPQLSQDSVARINDYLSGLRLAFCSDQDRERLLLAEEIIDRSRKILFERLRRVYGYTNAKVEQEFLAFRYISEGLIVIMDMDELLTLLARDLPALEISICCFSLFEGEDINTLDTSQSRLIFAYTGKDGVSPEISKVRFPTVKILPEGILPLNKHFSVIIEPISFGMVPIGTALFEFDTEKDVVFNIMLKMFTSLALKASFFVQQVQKHARKIEEANSERTRFFINLAHDTKTPLTLIKNYLEKYIREAGLNNDLKIIRQNVDMLISNMTNYLDTEKLRRGEVIYNHNRVIDTGSLIENKVILFRELAEKKEICFESHIGKHGFLKADPYAFDRIMNNLIDNAVKYTDPGGKIIVSLEITGDRIIFSVRDTGVGMSREKLDHIFSPEYLLSQKKESRRGMGMGLSIVKQIVESMGAEINIESEEGKGSCVSITAQLYPLAEGESIDTSSVASDVSLSDAGINPKDLEEEDLHPDKSNILIVDDNLQMLAFLKSGLKKKYNVYPARSGKEAFEKLETIPAPDIIISDVMMDEIDGHEFFLRLQKNEEFSNIPFVFLTAKDTIDEKIRSLWEGAIDYIFKPFVMEELTAKIDTIISSRIKNRKKDINTLRKNISSVLKTIYDNRDSNDEYFRFNQICDDFKISKRENEVLKLLIKGLLNKEISYRLNISLRTVNTHIYNIYRKFNVQTRIELVNKLKHLS